MQLIFPHPFSPQSYTWYSSLWWTLLMVKLYSWMLKKHQLWWTFACDCSRYTPLITLGRSEYEYFYFILYRNIPFFFANVTDDSDYYYSQRNDVSHCSNFMILITFSFSFLVLPLSHHSQLPYAKKHFKLVLMLFLLISSEILISLVDSVHRKDLMRLSKWC